MNREVITADVGSAAILVNFATASGTAFTAIVLGRPTPTRPGP